MARQPMWRIGVLAEKLSRQVNTLHKWEADGIIAEPRYRTSVYQGNRQYLKGEMELIIKTCKWWVDEHACFGGGTPRPKLFRLGQLHWHFRRYLTEDAKYGLVFKVPSDLTLPEMFDEDPDAIMDTILLANGEPCSLMDKIREVSRQLRDNISWRTTGKSVEYRMRALSDVFTSETFDELLATIERVTTYANSSEPYQ